MRSVLKTLLLISLAAVATFALAPQVAQAAAQWRITSVHGPQNMPPGDGDDASVEGQYVIQAYNVGDEGLNGSGDMTVTDTLPAGVSAIGWRGSNWDCSGSVFPSGPGGTVTCSHSSPVPAAEHDSRARGAAWPLKIDVSVSPGASGFAANEATVASEGGAVSASTVDTTELTSALTPFGFAPGSFGADVFDAAYPAGVPVRQAGSHPFELRVDFRTNQKLSNDPDDEVFGDLYYTEPAGDVRTVETRLPLGLVGNPEATPKCPVIKLNDPGPANIGACPSNTQVGSADLVLNAGKEIYSESGSAINITQDLPIYNVEPPRGTVAAFAFAYVGNPVWILAELDPLDHSVITRVKHTNQIYPPRSVELTFWGVPADPAHDALRLDPNAASADTAFGASSGAAPKPFLTLPGQCNSPAGPVRQRIDSWQRPGAFTAWESGAQIQATGCEDPRIRFEPSITTQPTSHAAASPTGLDIDLSVPQKDEAVSSASDLYSQSNKDQAIVTPNLKDAVTRLPLGMTVNPSIADGLVGCSEDQVGLADNEAPRCPDNSKIGTVEIESSLVPEPLEGSVYQAKQSENPFGSLLGFYTVARGNGLTIKLAAKVVSDPETGQLTTIFTDNPQLPFDHYRLKFFGGSRAPLVNPPLCGSYLSTAHFTAWNSSVPAVDAGDRMQITTGPNGKPCPDSLGGRPFAPGFDAKSLLPIAGAFSPFALDVSREDGEQELRTVETTLPLGLLGKLAGVSYCPDSTIASVSAVPGSGLAQRLSPSCPAASLIGHTDAAAGAGALPFHNPGSVYLAGPYKGAPLSLAIITPIVAGPLDLGSVVVRAAIYVDPASAQIRVVSDPIPDRIVADGNGFPLHVRSVRVAMDRDGFTLNPTSCDAMSVVGAIGSLQGANAAVSDRFQVGACGALGFRPKLSLSIKGATRRGGNPALRAVLKTKPGEANIAKARVTLPRSEFLAQDHIRTICTRVQFAADQCPKASVYGFARAFSPLLDEPLEGPVYLRSSSNPLPDLVAALRGQIDIDLAGRIDSVRGGIRTTFAAVPDAPVSRFVLEMKGGRKSLLENSRNLCKSTNRATVKLDGQNGKAYDSRPKLENSCGAKSGKRK